MITDAMLREINTLLRLRSDFMRALDYPGREMARVDLHVFIPGDGLGHRLPWPLTSCGSAATENQTVVHWLPPIEAFGG